MAGTQRGRNGRALHRPFPFPLALENTTHPLTPTFPLPSLPMSLLHAYSASQVSFG